MLLFELCDQTSWISLTFEQF